MQQSKDKFTDFLGMSDIIVFLINLFVIYRVIFSGLDVNSFLLIFFLQILLSAMFNLVKVLSKKPEKVAMNNTISSFLFIAMFIITAVLGTTISPYMFFWQASEEVEEEKSRHMKVIAGKPKLGAYLI